MIKNLLSLLLIAGHALVFTTGFAPSAYGHKTTLMTTTTTTTTTMNAVDAFDIETSRTAFFIWSFGASGAAGIARSAFPRMYKQVTYIRGLKGEGPTLGGDKTLGLSPLCGYPEDLAVQDVEKIVNNRLSIEQMVEKFPIEDNFLSRKGYVTFDAFALANKGANPLATRAVFDTFAQSTNACDPRIAQSKIDSYKEDVTKINGALLYAKAIGFLAVATLLFLLGLADIVAAGHAYNGWFPEWPGGENFPLCLFDPATGPWHIPEYWI
jgi:hypothetical protein